MLLGAYFAVITAAFRVDEERVTRGVESKLILDSLVNYSERTTPWRGGG
jgi:hypothetical protein